MYKVISTVQNYRFGAIYSKLPTELKQHTLQFNTVDEYLNLMSSLDSGRDKWELYLTTDLLRCIVENTAQGCPMARYSAIARLDRSGYLRDHCKSQVPRLLLEAFKGIVINQCTVSNPYVDNYDLENVETFNQITNSNTVENILSFLKNLPNKFDSQRFIRALARTLEMTGDFKSALNIAQKISNKDSHSLCLSQIAVVVAEKGDITKALEIANNISIEYYKQECFEAIERLKRNALKA